MFEIHFQVGTFSINQSILHNLLSIKFESWLMIQCALRARDYCRHDGRRRGGEWRVRRERRLLRWKFSRNSAGRRITIALFLYFCLILMRNDILWSISYLWSLISQSLCTWSTVTHSSRLVPACSFLCSLCSSSSSACGKWCADNDVSQFHTRCWKID